jgi:hypothetical protein
MEGEMKTTEMKPTTRLRYLLKDLENDLVLERQDELSASAMVEQCRLSKDGSSAYG